MNTVRSFWVGWGSLLVAGGTAYYFAKKAITADRAERHEAEMKRRRRQETLEYGALGQSSSSPAASHRVSDFAGSPSREANQEPAPTRHAPENEGQRVKEKSKYEASEPYRSKKGDRLT
ncbi:MAG: hypothetical protein M1816_000592 [Peltula sp. TS41687]|nr:MAG: hypothetical protein M1816_000592 [Peltula sp. TS41687]